MLIVKEDDRDRVSCLLTVGSIVDISFIVVVYLVVAFWCSSARLEDDNDHENGIL